MKAATFGCHLLYSCTDRRGKRRKTARKQAAEVSMELLWGLDTSHIHLQGGPNSWKIAAKE